MDKSKQQSVDGEKSQVVSIRIPSHHLKFLMDQASAKSIATGRVYRHGDILRGIIAFLADYDETATDERSRIGAALQFSIDTKRKR